MDVHTKTPDFARESPKPTSDAREDGRRWAFDNENDVAPVPFDGHAEAEAYVRSQNRQQGRDRWSLLDGLERLPVRSDGTPTLLPVHGGVSIAGRISVGCADALEIAGACAHAAGGRRRIVGRVVLTPVDGEVVLEIDGESEEWRFMARDARGLAIRLAGLAAARLSIGGTER
jgi:hypothetical protein